MTRQTSTEPLRVFFGHHKAASSWILKILSDLGHLNGFKIVTLNTAAELYSAFDPASPAITRDLLAVRNADGDYLHRIEPFVGFHVIRDPRDIAVSSYFSHLNSHPTDNWPELRDHQARLKKLDVNEGLLCDMEFCHTLPTNGFNVRPISCMAAWDYNQPNILELRYEDLVANPYAHFLQLFSYLSLLREDELGMKTLMAHLSRVAMARLLPGRRQRCLPKITSWNLLSAVYDNRYEKKADGRRPGVENHNSHYRKGVAGDWTNYFKPEHKSAFTAMYGDILARLGYESGEQW